MNAKRVNVRVLLVVLAAVVAGAAGLFLLRRFQVSRNAGNLAKLAKQRLEEGKPAEAIMLFGRYIGLRPQDHEAFGEYAKLVLARAESADATRVDIVRAYNTLEAAVRRSPENDDLRRRLAEFQLRIDRPSDARAHLDVLRERLAAGTLNDAAKDPDDGDRPALDADLIAILTARSLLGSGEVEEASTVVASMVGFDLESRSFPSSDQTDAAPKAAAPTEAYLILAAILEDKLRDKPAAELVLDRLVTDQSKDVRAWLTRSSWKRQRGDLDGAEADVARAMELDADNVDGLFARFEICVARKDFEAAAALAARAREVNALDERVYRAQASLAMQRGALAEAEQVLLDGVDQLPGKASLLLMLADALLQQSKLDQVSQTIDRLREVFGPSSPAVGMLEGRLLVAREQWAEAKAKLETVRPLVVGSPELVRQVDLYLGQCHAQLDEFDAQLDVNRRVLSDDPSSLAAKAGAASALAAAGKPKEALAEFESIAAAVPTERLTSLPQLWYPLLQLRMQSQASRPVADRDWSGVDSLLETLGESAKVSPTQLAVLRADVLVRKGEFDAARTLLEKTSQEDGVPQVWAALTTLVLRTSGGDEATAILSRVPPDVARSAQMLTVRAQVAGALEPEPRDRALAELEEVAGKLEGDEAAAALTAIAGAHVSAGNLATAERIWREIGKRQADNIRAREAVLELCINQGDLEKARAAAAEVSAVAGKDSARTLVADAAVKIYEARVQRDGRRSAGDKAADFSPAEVRMLEEARNLLIEAENDRPGWSQIQCQFAEIESLRGNVSAAIDRLKKAVSLGPSNPAVVRRLVALLYTANRLEEARDTISVLGTDGEQGSDRLTAEMQLRNGNADGAAALAESSVPRDSTRPDDLLWLGQILERAGKTDRAGEVFLRAVEIAPDRADVQLALFGHQAAADKKAAAERTLRKAADLLSPPQRQLVLAQGMETLGQNDEAESAFREAVAAAPSDLETHRALASFLMRCGRLGPARESLAVILDSTDTSKSAQATKAAARRMTAELIADRGSFREMEQAMDLLKRNLDEKGEMSVDDALLQVKLLTNRPEPASWKRAIGVLEDLARRQPLTLGQRILLAQLLEKVGRWDDCRTELIAVIASPNAPQTYVALLIEKLIDHGELASSRQWLARLQKTGADSPITVALEAKLAIAENDRQLAADAARKLMPGGMISGSQPEQLDAIARLMEQLGFPKAADKVFLQFSEASPDGAIARADFLGRQKRPREGLDLLESRWAELPLERLLSTAVQIARVQDDPREWTTRIVPWFAKARRLDPGSVMVKLLEAEVLALEGSQQEAEDIYRGLLADEVIDPTQKAVISNNLAFHLARPETVSEAKKLIEAAIDQLGPLPDLLDTRGMIHMVAGETQQAVADFTEAILNPSDVKFLHLAWAQYEAGEKSAALESLQAGRRRGLAKMRLSPDDRQRLEMLETGLGSTVDEMTAPPT